MNQPQHIRQLLEKVRRNACTPEELQELYRWLDEQAAAGEPYTFNNEEERSALQQNMREAVLAGISHHTPVKTVVRNRLMKYAAAAAVLLIGGSAAWYFGRAKAVTLATVPGQVIKKALPDGSTVWLNDNSEVEYHTNFAHERTIELKRGEAFFQVKKDASHPFTVRSEEVNTTVKGTSFSVKMFGEAGNIKVSVVTGKVLVYKQQDTLGYLLPGQRLRFIKQLNKSVIDTVQTAEANGWTQGELLLQNASLSEVIQWLRNHYNITIQNRRNIDAGNYYVQVKRDISLQEMINILNLLGAKDHIRFELNSNTVIIQ